MNRIISDIINAHIKAVDQFKAEKLELIEQIAQIITDCIKNDGRIYLCGNGGSAADCQHIAGEFVGRFRRERKALPAVAFSVDTSVLTCIGNDYGFEDIFARQVDALVTENDLLWAFSTSGSSPNIIKAARHAKNKKAKIIAFTGKAKSELENISDICFCADAEQTSTAQEIHMLAYHIICDLVEHNFMDNV